MNSTLIVFFGAGVGGVLRHGVNLAALRWPLAGFAVGFPWGTMAINIVGSALMGLVAGWFALRSGTTPNQDLRLFLATGILGGFTTFSAFSLDAMLLWQRGEAGAAAFYVLGSVAISLAGLAGGLALMRVAS